MLEQFPDRFDLPLEHDISKMISTLTKTKGKKMELRDKGTSIPEIM